MKVYFDSTGKNRGSIQTWEKIAKALKVNVFDLTESEESECENESN